MTQWNGIKVGDVYKRRGMGCCSSPFLFMRRLECLPPAPQLHRGVRRPLLSAAVCRRPG